MRQRFLARTFGIAEVWSIGHTKFNLREPVTIEPLNRRQEFTLQSRERLRGAVRTRRAIKNKIAASA